MALGFQGGAGTKMNGEPHPLNTNDGDGGPNIMGFLILLLHQNAISTDLHTIRTPEMHPHFSVSRFHVLYL